MAALWNLLIHSLNKPIYQIMRFFYQTLQKVFVTLQNCDPNHRKIVTHLTNRKSCDSAHEPSLDQTDKLVQRNREKINESRLESYNEKINKEHNISIYAGLLISPGLRG